MIDENPPSSRKTRAAPAARLSLGLSSEFALHLNHLMDECGLSSYSLYLEVDYPRSTLTRWLTGKTRIPSDAAMKLVKILEARIERLSSSWTLRKLHELLQVQFADSGISMLQAELRARRIPIQPTLDALRAAKVLPPSGACDEHANTVRNAHEEVKARQCQS